MKDNRIYVQMTDNEKATSEWLVLVAFDEAEMKDGTRAYTHRALGEDCPV